MPNGGPATLSVIAMKFPASYVPIHLPTALGLTVMAALMFTAACVAQPGGKEHGHAADSERQRHRVMRRMCRELLPGLPCTTG